MQCLRCGAIFEGRFCPHCGTPAGGGVPGPAAGWPCPRCGTPYAGDACPRCGFPRAYAYVPRPPAPAKGGRSLLSVLWTLSMAMFLFVVALDFAGLALAPGVVVPGIQGISEGATSNAALDVSGSGWTFIGAGTPVATGAHRSTGGNPDGYLESTLPSGTGVAGYWRQSFQVGGSSPFAGDVRLDVDVTLGSSTSEVRVNVYVVPSPEPPSADRLAASLTYAARTPWERTQAFPADERLGISGRYDLVVEVSPVSSGSGTPTVVGLDNVELRWTTDASVVFYLFVPTPVVLFVSQDVGLFLGYFGLLVAVVAGAGVYHAFRERKDTIAAFTAPIEAIGTRLRSRSAWIAVAQVWMALTFFQVVVILLTVAFIGEPTSPLDPSSGNIWLLLFDLLNASVYEELVFRVLLMGAPMAVGSVLLRILEINRSGGTRRGATSPARHLAASLRYLFGGTVHRGSSKEILLASWAILVASAVTFGAAHAPGWGWWKVLPSSVAGLAFGYLFLRHGASAAILAHFVNDYLTSLSWIGVGGDAVTAVIALLFLGVAIAGTGFFVWYLIVAERNLRELGAKLLGRPPPVRRAAKPSPVAGPYGPPLYPFPPPATPMPPPSPPPDPASPGGPLRDPTRIPAGYVPTYLPPPYGYPPVRFQCPACGWVEARYSDGRFICARCGKTA